MSSGIAHGYASKHPLPYDSDAERAVLGSIILNANALAEVRPLLTEDDWIDEKHIALYRSMLELDDRQVAVDTQTLLSELVRTNLLEAVGGLEYISELAASVPTSAHVQYYAQIVRDKSDLRSIIHLARRAQQQAFAGDRAAEILSALQLDLDRLGEHQHTRPIQWVPDLYGEYSTDWEARITGTKSTGLKTGIYFIDKWIENGIEPDMTITIGARPSDGKSTLLQNILVNISLTHGPALLCSLEERASRVLRRVHKMVASQEQFTKALRDRDIPARNLILRHALDRLRTLPLYIEDNAPYIEDLRMRVKAHMVRHPDTSVVAIDYLQMVRTRNPRLTGRDKIDFILDELMELKRSINRPLIILSQFRKESIEKTGPHLALLKETGRIEADSDIVLLLWDANKDKETADEAPKFTPETELVVDLAKNRDGRPMKFRLLWYKAQYLILSPGQRQAAPEKATTGDLFPAQSPTPAQTQELFPREPGDEPPGPETTTNEPSQSGFPWEDQG